MLYQKIKCCMRNSDWPQLAIPKMVQLKMAVLSGFFMLLLSFLIGCEKFPSKFESKDIVFPFADAGRDATYLFGETVVLDGAQSREPANRALKYRWTGDRLNPSVIKLADSARVTFTPPAPGRYVFTLTVILIEDTFKTARDQVQVDIMQADWHVSKSKPLAPTIVRTIAQALDKAAAGDTIFVEAETYKENLRISKPKIFLYSSDSLRTIIDGSSTEASTLFFQNVQGGEIRGFTITGGRGNDSLQIDVGGVTCNEASNIVIRNNRITNNVDGIRLVNARDILIIQNEMARNIFNGIRTTSSSFEVAGNQIHDNSADTTGQIAGITLEGKGDGLVVRIYDNTFRNNRSNHIKLSNNAEVLIEKNQFFEAGGGILALEHVGARLTLTANEFRGIEAASVFCQTGTQLEMQNNILDNAGRSGERKGVDLVDCIGNLLNNQIRGYPIGIILFSSPMVIRQNIFENNQIAIKVSGNEDCPTVQGNILNGNQTNFDYSQTMCPRP